MTTIKSITTNTFAISLVANPYGYYRIIYVSKNKTHTSEKLHDYRMASELFDLKYEELHSFN